MTDFDIFEELCKLQENAGIELENARKDWDNLNAYDERRGYFATMYDIKREIYNAICKKNNEFYKNFIETEIV